MPDDAISFNEPLLRVVEGTQISLRLGDSPSADYLAHPQEDGSIRLEPVPAAQPEPTYPRYGRGLMVTMGRLSSQPQIGGLPLLTYRVFATRAYRSVGSPSEIEVWVDGNDTMHAGVYGPPAAIGARQYADVDDGPQPPWLRTILDDAASRLGKDF